MRVGLQTWGTDGDFLPFLALAIGLKNAGHDVTLAYTSVDGKDYSHRKDVEGINLIRANGDAELSKTNPYAIDAKPGSFKEYSILLEKYFEPLTETMYEASSELAQKCNLVIGHSICHTLATASQKFNVPRVSVALTPLIVRSDNASPIGVNLGTIMNSFLWNVGGVVSTQQWFKAGKAIRKREGLPPIKSLQKEVFTSDLLTIVAASENLVPRQSDWKEHIQVSGFLNLPSDQYELLPQDLQDFLSDGEPPVYMTFGSCMQYELEASTKLLVEAAELSGKRAIIQSDWLKLNLKTSSKIYRAERLPHNLIFPKCNSVVHHGGAGTTQAALLAGKPSVVVSHGFDQTYWSEHLYNRGAATEPILKTKATAQGIAARIKHLDKTEHIHQKASDIGQRMRTENGVEKAVQLINNLQLK